MDSRNVHNLVTVRHRCSPKGLMPCSFNRF